MKIFTINSGSVSEGAVIKKLLLKGANLEIPAIIVGEEGRGRERGVYPSSSLICSTRNGRLMAK
ncbi:hypothetical protein IPN41_00760 [Candidatus Falkowbacteria bacterium]|nr:MAG: hypothetical protein IPN41_00760 [Candidatus Falkowbacteria bacterium]